MSEWALKRFWTAVTVSEGASGFAVLLDDRPVRTPAKRQLLVPTRTIAERIASEWEAQVETVNPLDMPWTRSANAALDKVAMQRAEVTGHLIGYAGTDLLCYRAEGPQGLIARQKAGWDPVLDWISREHGVTLETTVGVMPIAQAPETLAVLAEPMATMSDFHITAFYDLVTLSGSYALALAVIEKQQNPDAIWRLSRLDETWQIEQWGADEDAAEVAQIKQNAFLHAAELYFAG